MAADGLWAEAFRVQRRGVNVLAGLAGALATCGPLALGIALDETAIGVTACFGGLNGSLGVPRGPLRERLGWGAAAGFGCCVSAVLATAVQDSVVASVVASFAIVWLSAFLRTFGVSGGLTGFVIGAIFVIFNGIPADPLSVADRGLWFALGTLGGLLLTVAAYARGAPATSPDAPPLTALLAPGARQLRDAISSDKLLRAHALRIASIIAATTLLYQLLGLEHGYWVPLTVLAVLQPEEHASSVRAIQRAIGTLVGTASDRRVHDRGRRPVADDLRAGRGRLRPLRAALARLLLAGRDAHADGPAHDQRGRLSGRRRGARARRLERARDPRGARRRGGRCGGSQSTAHHPR